MPIVGRLRMCFDLVSGWTPLDDAIEHEAGLDHGVHVRGDRSVLLDHTVDEPVRDSLAFDEVVVERLNTTSAEFNGRPSRSRSTHR